jgi:DNA replication protein DnaC
MTTKAVSSHGDEHDDHSSDDPPFGSLTDDEALSSASFISRRSMDMTSGSLGEEDTRSGSSSTWKSRRSERRSTPEFEVRRSDRKSYKNNINIQQLAINKLRYDSIGLMGRERETETLQSCFNRTTKNNEHGRKELILIKGYSGVGKSMLANSLEKSALDTENGIFVRGKFDINNT